MSVGYRINLKNVTHFNMVYAATERLNHQSIWSDDELLKNGRDLVSTISASCLKL
ncbi:MAG: hypothetical protein J6P09_01685 [Methanobrevibacter sp.]|nr:hypothetical protein [Methanobrevibacter sp.]